MISVLYVDDEPELLDLGRQFLELSGSISVDTLADPREALALLRTEGYDCIISDYQMPEMNGITLLKEVRKEFSDLPFILFTGRGREEIVIEAINSGADSYLQKGGGPASQVAELVHTVQHAVERRKAEKARRESELTARALLDSNPDAVVLLDINRKIIASNEGLARRFGIPRSELTGRLLHDLYSEEHRISRDKRFVEAIETGMPVQFVDQRNGNYYENNIYPIFDDNRQITRMAVYSRDITEEKQAEEILIRKNKELEEADRQIAESEKHLKKSYRELVHSGIRLRESQHMLTSIINFLPDATFAIDTRGKVIAWNYAIEEMTGIAESEMMGKGDHEYAIPFYGDRRPILIDLVSQDRDEAKNRYMNIRWEGSTITAETTSPMPKGTPRILWGKASLLYNDNGEITGAIESIRDITSIREAESTLAALWNKDREALHVARMGHFEFEVATQSFIFNDQIYELFGTNVEKMGGYTVSAEEFGKRFVNPEDIPLIREAIGEAIQTRDLSHQGRFEGRITRGDGADRIMAVWFRIEKDPHGHTIKFYGVNQDVTEWKSAETALQHANTQLQLLNGITRHDIQNQLVAIVGNCELAQIQATDPGLRERIARIGKGADTIGKLIQFLQEYGEVGRSAPVWFNVSAAVRQASSAFDLGAVKIISGDESLEIFADPLFERVFYNLIDNSARYGMNITKIWVHWRSRGDCLTLVYEDDGAGIPEGEKSQIFERGFGKNTGLGLFMIRGILGITGISITETGVLGEGARFEMVVPAGGFRYTSPQECDGKVQPVE
jgi:PAS domain S-box-containing protein